MLLLVDGVEAQSDHDADGVAHLAEVGYALDGAAVTVWSSVEGDEGEGCSTWRPHG